MSLLPARLHHPPVRLVHHDIEMPYRLGLGDSREIVLLRFKGVFECHDIRVIPREFWIIECGGTRIRLLGTYAYGLVQYEEFGAHVDDLIAFVCDGVPNTETCLKNRSVVLTAPTWFWDDTTGRLNHKNIVVEYDASSDRLIYQEWMQWDVCIDFLAYWRKQNK